MFSWLIDPSKSFAEGMEIAFAIGLFLTTLIVVMGLVGEYRKGDWWRRHANIFEVLVVMGVVGEMLTETGAFWYSLKTQAIAGLAIAQATQKANDAAVQAGKLGVTVRTLPDFVTAKKREFDAQFNRFQTFADNNKQQTDSLISDLNAKQREWDKARDDALASASKVAAALDAAKAMQADFNARAKEIIAENQSLEAQLQPRDFSPDEIKQIVTRLKPFSGRTVLVQPYINDPEGFRLMIVILRTLRAAGIVAKPSYWSPDTSSEMKFLLGMEIDTPADKKDLADALEDAFRHTKAGVRPQTYVVTWTPDATIHIGVKPFEIPGVSPPLQDGKK